MQLSGEKFAREIDLAIKRLAGRGHIQVCEKAWGDIREKS